MYPFKFLRDHDAGAVLIDTERELMLPFCNRGSGEYDFDHSLDNPISGNLRSALVIQFIVLARRMPNPKLQYPTLYTLEEKFRSEISLSSFSSARQQRGWSQKQQWPSPFSIKTLAIDNCALALTSIIYSGSEFIGISASWSSAQQVTGLVFVTTSDAVFVRFSGYRPTKRAIRDENWEALQTLLVQNGDPSMTLVAFDATKIALALHRQFQLSMRAADLGNYMKDDRNRRGPLENIGHAFRNEFCTINAGELLRRVGPDAIGFVDDEGESACYQAWIFLHTAMRIRQELAVEDSPTLRLDTRLVSEKHLGCISFIHHQIDLLDGAKPTSMKNDFTEVGEDGFGDHIIRNERYSNKVRVNRNQVVVLESDDGAQVHATAKKVRGKTTTISLQNREDTIAIKIKSIHVIGREDSTVSEAEQRTFLLGVLQGRHDLDASVFIRLVWFGRTETPRVDLELPLPSLRPLPTTYPCRSSLSALNPSQLEVAHSILARLPPITICHGPPGTGKTRTISAIVKQYDGVRGVHEQKETVWICAQSNVGVKNIAEALVKGGVEKFKLVVSKDFHEEWHEHLYETMEDKLVRLDQIPEGMFDLGNWIFDDVHIVLCTLGMLSNPMLRNKGIVRNVPVSRLIIDEASQVYIGQYMHLFHQFRSTLHKIAFFGDPKQLPPFKSEDIRGLYSVFEVKHLAVDAFFLDTQYRMPEVLGNFISSAIYEGKLRSQHDIKAIDCVTFVDAANGAEISDSNSWKNLNEVQTIVHLVRKYYRHKNFAVITPYEAQRAAIQTQLKTENLPWESVFTVDSYQGNETEFALISLVRTSKPGFLWSRHRVNVMLTRCKKGMVIVTNQVFLKDCQVKSTLIGEMEHYWDLAYRRINREDSSVRSSHWVDWRKIVEGTAKMPGSSFMAQFISSSATSSSAASTPPGTLVKSSLPTKSGSTIMPITPGRSTTLATAPSISIDYLNFPTLPSQQRRASSLSQTTHPSWTSKSSRTTTNTVWNQTSSAVRNPVPMAQPQRLTLSKKSAEKDKERRILWSSRNGF